MFSNKLKIFKHRFTGSVHKFPNLVDEKHIKETLNSFMSRSIDIVSAIHPTLDLAGA